MLYRTTDPSIQIHVHCLEDESFHDAMISQNPSADASALIREGDTAPGFVDYMTGFGELAQHLNGAWRSYSQMLSDSAYLDLTNPNLFHYRHNLQVFLHVFLG